MKRKVLIGLVMAMVLSLSACGGKESTGNEGKESTPKTESSTSGEKKDADTEKESKNDSKKKEVSLEALETLEESPAEDFEFTPDGKNPAGWSLCGYNGKDEMVVIPEEVDGKKVVSITSEAFGEESGVKAVKISDSVERIGKRAFFGNKDLQFVVFGNNVKEIGLSAFQGCSALERVELNEGLEKLDGSSFAIGEGLAYIYIPDTVVEINEIAITASMEKLVIAGKTGSKAEEYAKQWNYTFEAVE